MEFDNETKLCALLSGLIREVNEGKDKIETILKLAAGIDKMYTNPTPNILDELQKHTVGYGKGWMCRESSNGRGMRIHETELDDAVPTIKEAIENYLLKHKQK